MRLFLLHSVYTQIQECFTIAAVIGIFIGGGAPADENNTEKNVLSLKIHLKNNKLSLPSIDGKLSLFIMCFPVKSFEIKMRYLRHQDLLPVHFQRYILPHHILGTKFQQCHIHLRHPSFHRRNIRFHRIQGILLR